MNKLKAPYQHCGDPRRRTPAAGRVRPDVHARRSADGFTLLEVLIAVLVLSIGLLALAGLQLKALTTAHSSYFRSIAAVQATDLVERSWGNICPLSDGSPAGTFEAIRSDWIAANTDGGNGSPVLPGWDGSNSAFDPTDRILTVEIRWDEPRIGLRADGSSGSTEVFTYSARIPRLLCGRESFS